MRWQDGELVANPDARYAISSTTRDMLRDEITKAFSEETPLADLVDVVRNSGAFSSARAKTIANTEVARSQSEGIVKAWKQTGVVEKVRWSVSSVGCCDECAENEAAGPVELGKRFPA